MANLDKSLGEYLNQLDTAETFDSLWDIFVGYLNGLGANLISYHHIAPPFGADKHKVIGKSDGFTQDWVDTYTEEEFYLIDPIIQLVSQSVNPFRWSEVGKLVKLTSEQKRFVSILEGWLKGDGLAIPAFGPSGRIGSFGVGHRETIENWDADKERIIYWACQAFHHRACEMRLKALKHDFVLTPRETKVLKAMAQGLSDPMICGIINARLDSVRNTIQSLMRKMGVSDRASLIMRGVACEIIER